MNSNMAIKSPPRDFSHQNGTFFLPFLSPTVTPSHEDSDPYHELLFVPFQPPTKIDFDTCRMGQSSSCKLNIFNPKDTPLTALLVDSPPDCPVLVETIRLPISESVTAFSESHFYHLPPNSSALLRLTWTPTFTEDLYLPLTFKWGNRFASKVVLSGKVQQVAVKSRRVLFADNKNSLSVTKSLSSSFRPPLRTVSLNSPCPEKPLIHLHQLITPTPSSTFLEPADTSISSHSFIASTPMGANATRPLINEHSFVHPSVIKRPLNSRQGDASCVANRALPFSVAGGGSFDSEWAEKQSRAFTHWLNYVLTPPDSSNFSATLQQTEGSPTTTNSTSRRSVLNLTSTFRSSPPPSEPPAAVTEPQYSLTQRKYLSRLRSKMQELVSSRDLAAVFYQLHAEVEKARLRIRPDKPIWKDVGLREDLLCTLLSYHPLWLRLGLEAVFSCHVPVSHEMDSRLLKKFLANNLITSADISAKYAHRRVPGLFNKGYELAIGKHVTFKFFALILFLDMAKKQRLIDHDPCLFLKSSRVKCSRELLLYFSRTFLQGEGDITKHLHTLGYHVSHKQSFLEEFDYRVNNLATDLRDGIRLSRLLELLTQDWSLSDKLRIPATSLTPRLANNKLLLDKLKELLHFQLAVSNKDIALGHKEKTLSLIWALIFHFRVRVKIDEMLLRREISYIRSNHCIRDDCVPLQLCTGEDQSPQFDSNTLQLLLEWCNVVCRVFGLRVTDFTSCFRDGRALCYILHYYHPSLLSRHLISEDAKCNLELFCDKMSSLGGIPSLPPSTDFHQTGPNEKVVIMYVAYLCAQQLELREEIRAAIVIQRAYKRHCLRNEQILINQISYDSQLDLFHSQTQAATTIQACFRGILARRQLHSLQQRESLLSDLSFQIANSYLSEEISSVLTQTIPESISEKQQRDTALQYALSKIKSVLSETSVCLIQNSLRDYAGRTKENNNSLLNLSTELVDSAITEARNKLQREKLDADTREDDLIEIQVYNIDLTELLESHEVNTQLETAAIIIQHWYRVTREKNIRKKQLLKQTHNNQHLDYISNYLVTSFLTQSTDSLVESRNKAATDIQLHFRRFLRAKACRGQFLLMRQSASTIQFAVRSFLTKKHNQHFLSALSVRIVNCTLTHSLNSLARNSAAVRIQTWYRTQLCVRRYQHLLQSLSAAACAIQRAYRSHSAAVSCRREYLKIRHASVTMQRYFRIYLAVKRSHEQFLQLISSRMVEQSLANAVRIIELKREQATLTIQTHYRTYLCVKEFQLLKLYTTAAARTIQFYYRNYLISMSQRERFLKLKISAQTIQHAFRVHLVKLEKSSSALTMFSDQLVTQTLHSSLYQLTLARSRAALSIQNWYRMVHCEQQYKRLMLERNSAAVVLQHAFRNSRISVEYRHLFLSMKNSAILIQRSVRRVIARRQQNSSLLYVFTASLIQEVVSHSQSIVSTERSQAAKCIQNWYRKIQRVRALKLLIEDRNSRNIETTAGEIIKRVLFKSTDLLLQTQRVSRAALTIQAYFRGYSVRQKTQNTSLLNIKRRLSEATNSALASQQLRNKIPKYIDTLLNARSLEQKYNILDKLKSSVYVSESCAIKVREEGLDVLYMLVDNNVRSPSIIQRVEKAADVLLQLAKWPSISKDIFIRGRSIPIITDVLQKIHATQPSTVRILARLLIQFCAYPDQMDLMHRYHHVSILKIHKCLLILKRKHMVGSKRMSPKAKKELSQSIYELESLFSHFRYAN